MPKDAQGETFQKVAKKRLVDRGQTITSLAENLGIPRNSVSRAINRGCFPRVIREIKRELALK